MAAVIFLLSAEVLVLSVAVLSEAVLETTLHRGINDAEGISAFPGLRLLGAFQMYE